MYKHASVTNSFLTLYTLYIVVSTLLLGAHMAHAAATTSLSLESYIFENDDNTNNNIGHADGSTQMAAGSTTITNVKKGERLNVRMHIKNQGTNSLASTSLGLFYDRNDGYWTKVRANAPASTSAGNCTDTNWDCAAIPTSSGSQIPGDIAIDATGVTWSAYYESTLGTLAIAREITKASAVGLARSWATTSIVSLSPSSVSIAVATGSTSPWIAYGVATTGSDLHVSRYVGTGGTGCTSSEWTCAIVDSTNSVGGDGNSIAFDLSGAAWVAYFDFTNSGLRVARYVGSGGTGCATTAWTCTAVDTANFVGQGASMAFDTAGNPWVAYTDLTTGGFRVARYVVSGGTGCASTAWTCVAVETTSTSAGSFTVAFDPLGNPAVSYNDATNDASRIARFVGTGGVGCASTAWSCSKIDNSNFNGAVSRGSMAFDASGNPWVSYYHDSVGLRLARYVGTGGSGCTSSAWNCTTLASDLGKYSSIVFDANGNALIGYERNSSPNIHIARQKRSGEITVSPAISFQFGTSTFLMATSSRESHVDMMTVTDTTSRDDADCVTAGATWNNGLAFQAEEGYGLVLPAGNATVQCTEISFMIDTSQAKEGTTYRLALATKDNWSPNRGIWRGPRGGASSTFPMFTIETATTSVRISKDVQYTMPNCADTNWGCEVVDLVNDVGQYTSLVFDPSGTPWVSYYHYDDALNGCTTDCNLRLARYVGSGGTGCATSAWTCTVVDATGDVGADTSIAFDPAGNPWVSYYDGGNSDLRVARYVGTGGTGCATTAWTCTTVESTNFLGIDTSIAFSSSGVAWVSYYSSSGNNIRIARFVGSGGLGCASTAWTCASIGVANSSGENTSIAFDASGNPWVTGYDSSAEVLRVSSYVGTAGTGCETSAWTCTIVDYSSGAWSSIAFDPSGNPWVSYRAISSLDLRIARYVGTGGTGCTGNTVWTCTAVDSTNDVGLYTSLSFDSGGNPWMSYYHASTTCDVASCNLRVARYVGSGGTGCAVATWTCTAIDTTNNVGQYTSIAFDASGAPWVSYYDLTNTALRIAKLHLPPTKLSATSSMPYNGRNASHGDSRYRLGIGKSPRTDADGTCSGNTDSKGYCGVLTDDADYDAITGQASTSPLFSGAFLNANNTDAPTITWTGQSSVSPTTNLITIQVYRFGSTNAWTTLTPTSNTCTGTGVNTDCTIVAGPTANLTEYYEVEGLDNWMYVRVYQAQSSTTATTLKTDRFIFVASTPTPVISQLHYRFRTDEGGEVTAPWITNEDTPVTTATSSLNVFKGDRRRLRILISNATADATNVAYRLEYSSTSCAVWTAVATNGGATTQEWVMDYSQYAPEGSATTHATGLTAPGGKSFVAGQLRVESNQTTATTLTSSQYSEFEYAFRSTAIAQTAVTYCFRLTNAGVTTNFVYSVQPQMTLSGAPRPQTGGGGSENNGTGVVRSGGSAGGGGAGGGESGGGGGPPQGGGGAGGGGGDSG